MKFVIDKHENQLRNNQLTPYIVHPIDVFRKTTEWGIKDDKVWKAALAHDILEDVQSVSFEMLCDAIGVDEAKIVRELTFVPKSDGKRASVQKAEYIDSFQTASIQALTVKIADRICNTSDFIKENINYAPKYWRKASSLIKAFYARKDELCNCYGEEVYQKIEYAIDSIELAISVISKED